jgi:cytochrome c oxidase subunit 2
VNVTERQFAFEFSYPSAPQGDVVSPVLYVPKGQPVVFKLRSLDVIHSFFVPNFSQKLDAVPGITTTLRVTPTRLGTYPVECTELCGAGHAFMRSAVQVVTPSAFQSWLKSQKANGAPPVGTPPPNAALAGEPGAPRSAPAGGTTEGGGSSSSGSANTSSSSTSSNSGGSAAQGKAIFTGSAGCASCHTLAAAGTTGTVGPNLGTDIVPQLKKAGMSLKQYIQESIVKPNAYITPGYQPNIMPQNFSQTLTSSQIQSLVSFIAANTK